MLHVCPAHDFKSKGNTPGAESKHRLYPSSHLRPACWLSDGEEADWEGLFAGGGATTEKYRLVGKRPMQLVQMQCVNCAEAVRKLCGGGA